MRIPLHLSLVGLALSGGATAALDERQLHSLPVLGPGQSPSASPSTSSLSTVSSPPKSSSPPTSSSERRTTPTEEPTKTESAAWELTTVFTQPTECSSGITQYAGPLSTLDYWLNIPFPGPGLTFTSCFPPVLVTSVTASVDQPPYDQLVCPDQWGQYDYNSTYRICCPKYVPVCLTGCYIPRRLTMRRDFGISHLTNRDRPGLGAWCTSWAWPGTPAVYTRYFTDGGSSVIKTTLGTSENWLVRATPFDGYVPGSGHMSHPTSGSGASVLKPGTTTTTTAKSGAFAVSAWTRPTALGDVAKCVSVIATFLWMAVM